MSTPTAEQVRAEGLMRLRRALELIERAQNDLSSACAELSTLEGGIPVWNACNKLTDRVHAFWYRVERFRNGGKFRLDSDAIHALRRRLAAQQEARP